MPVAADRTAPGDGPPPARRRRGCLGTVARLADLLVLAVPVAALAARHVRPTGLTWGLQPLGTFLPFVAVAFVAIALGRIWRGSRPVRVLYAVVAVWLGVRFGGPLGRTTEPSAGDLTLVTYNVPQWRTGTDSLKQSEVDRLVADIAPDVFAFQEVSVHYLDIATLRTVPFVRRLQDVHGYTIAQTPHTKKAPASFTAQPVLSRLTLDEGGDVRLSTDDTGVTEAGRAQLRLPLDSATTSAGSPFVLYSVHLATHGAAKPWHDPDVVLWRPSTWRSYLARFRDGHVRRAAEADTLRARLDRETAPLVVAGDFNATPHEWVFGRIAGARGGLTDALGHAGRGWNATYHRRWSLVRIDHVLASPEWTVVSAHRPRRHASDHWPVAVRLRLDTARAGPER